MYKAPRGTSDILPDEQIYWRYIEAKATALCQLYGYNRLDTPSFEDANLFTRSIGEGTDIVTKEMYVFEDRSHNLMALRPEGTASVCRAYLEHGMNNLPQPVNLRLDHIKEDHKHINIAYFGTVKSGVFKEKADDGAPSRWFTKEELENEPEDKLIPNVKEWALKALDMLGHKH